MLYREMGKTGIKISVLGYGCLRYPQKNGKIDEERAERQIISAIEKGVNYFDTAYIYNGGKGEGVLGRILAKGCRDKVYIATKLPPYLVNSQKDMENILETQLKRLCTDRIEFYLIHGLNDYEGWRRLRNLGVEEFFSKAKSQGKVKFLGFSYHGEKEEFKKIVDDYPWDFCQIQYNYLDENNQAGRTGLEYAASKGLGVVIMEPLRGGSLAGEVPKEIEGIFNKAETKRSPAEWALRWIWNQPGVTMLLSGMNEESQIEENVSIADNAYPNTLNEKELGLIEEAKHQYRKLMKVGCTGCSYCMPCPAGVDIPTCFSYYNTVHLFKKKRARLQYMAFLRNTTGGKPSHAALCKDCGKCEKVCPQHIKIREELKNVSKDMDIPILIPAIWLLRKYLSFRSRLKGAGQSSKDK